MQIRPGLPNHARERLRPFRAVSHVHDKQRALSQFDGYEFYSETSRFQKSHLMNRKIRDSPILWTRPYACPNESLELWDCFLKKLFSWHRAQSEEFQLEWQR